jgi:hypothetical protein
MKSPKQNEVHLNPITNWILNRMQRNVAPETSSQEGSVYLEAHGCYDMGHDCDTANLFDGHR